MNRQSMIDFLEEEITRCKTESQKAYKENIHSSENAEKRYWDGCIHALEATQHRLKFEPLEEKFLQMYKCRFYMQVNSKGYFYALYKDIEIPFVPSPSIDINLGSWKAIPKTVSWNDGKFICFTEDDNQIIEGKFDERTVLNQFIGMGWSLVSK